MSGATRFCTKCGKSLPINARFCAGCGASLAPLPVAPSEPAVAATPAPPDPQQAPTTPRPSPKRGPWRETWWGRAATVAAIGGVMALAAAGIGFAAVTEFVGESDAPAQYLPNDTFMYASIDFIQLRDVDRLERFVDAVDSAIDDWDLDIDWDPYDYLDLDDPEVDIEDDLLPWIGRTAAVGVFDAVGDEQEYDRDLGAVSVVFVVAVRDPEAASEFLGDYLDDVSRASNEDLDTTTVDGWDGWEYSDDREGETTFWIITDDAIIVGTSEEAVEVALDAQSTGDNLRSTDAFSAVVAAGPDSPTISGYVSGDLIEDAVDEAFRYQDDPISDAIRDELSSIGGYGMTASLRDDGLLFTYSVVDEDADDIVGRLSPSSAAAELPDDTFLMGSYEIEPGAFAGVGDQFQDWDDELYDEAVDAFDDLFRFDPFTEVLPFIGGRAMFAYYETNIPISEYSDIEAGVIAAIGVTDSKELESPFESVLDAIADEGPDVDRDGDAYIITDEWEEFDTAVALTDTELVVAVPSESYDDWPTTGTSLADTELYQWVENGLHVPVVGFIDFERFFDTLDPYGSDDVQTFVDLVPAAGLGFQTSGDSATVAVFVAVDY